MENFSNGSSDQENNFKYAFGVEVGCEFEN